LVAFQYTAQWSYAYTIYVILCDHLQYLPHHCGPVSDIAGSCESLRSCLYSDGALKNHPRRARVVPRRRKLGKSRHPHCSDVALMYEELKYIISIIGLRYCIYADQFGYTKPGSACLMRCAFIIEVWSAVLLNVSELPICTLREKITKQV
jgi:hypothetical protein